MSEHQTKAPPPDWRADTIACWRRLPNKTFFFPLLAAWLLLFQCFGNSTLGYIHTSSLFRWLFFVYNIAGSDNSYGNVIPLLVAGLFWWKRQELLALPLKLWWPGWWLLLASAVLHLAGFLIQQPMVSIVALMGGIYALMGMAWGPQWLRHSLYPFILFVFSLPLAAHLNFILFPLRMLVTWLVEMVSHLIGINVLRIGTQLVDPSGTYGYDVAAACGGLRSLIALFLLATVYAFALFRSPWKRIFLIATAVPFAVLGNMARLLCIIIAAELGGQKWGDYVHEGGPWGVISLLPYLPGIIGLIFLGRWLDRGGEKTESAGKEHA